MAKKHLLHVRSKQLNGESNGPKLPSPSDIEYGEIAVNYADGYETLSLKNSANNIVTISTDNIIKKQIDLKADSTRVDEIDEVVSETFDKVKNSCGFDETMSYTPKNELIQDCTTLSDAIELVAEKANVDMSNLATKIELNEGLSNKQDTLISGTNIKSINGESILGNGNISLSNSEASNVILTQQEYDELAEKDKKTIYFIVG